MNTTLDEAIGLALTILTEIDRVFNVEKVRSLVDFFYSQKEQIEERVNIKIKKFQSCLVEQFKNWGLFKLFCINQNY